MTTKKSKRERVKIKEVIQSTKNHKYTKGENKLLSRCSVIIKSKVIMKKILLKNPQNLLIF